MLQTVVGVKLTVQPTRILEETNRTLATVVRAFAINPMQLVGSDPAFPYNVRGGGYPYNVLRRHQSSPHVVGKAGHEPR